MRYRVCIVGAGKVVPLHARGYLASARARAPVSLPLPAEAESPIHAFFEWDGVPRGGRGTVYATDGFAGVGKVG